MTGHSKYSFKDGYLEAVMFALYKDGKIATEFVHHRKGFERGIPSGGVEEKDKSPKKNSETPFSDDYIIQAMKRECEEELRVIPTKYEKLFEHKTSGDKHIWFHVFLVTEWDGEVSDHIVEPPGSDIKVADVHWMDVHSCHQEACFETTKKVCDEIISRGLARCG